MYVLSVGEALLAVRRNLDELVINDSDMLSINDSDSDNFESVTAGCLPDAINEIHRAAPAVLLEGVHLKEEDLETMSIDSNGVLSFDVHDVMERFICFKAADSPYVVTQIHEEYSGIGMMQHNPYTAGDPMSPVLIIKQKSEEEEFISSFRYYSIGSKYADPTQAVERMEYIPKVRYDASASSYLVSTKLVDQVLNLLTAKVLAIYNESDKSNYFLNQTILVPQQ